LRDRFNLNRMPRMTPAATAQPAISIQGISKRYGRLTAVRDLRLEVEQGEVFGFLGLNGAGKTTTIRIILDLLRPDSGKAFILGFDCQRQGLKARALAGYLPGEMGIYGDMTGREVLDLFAGLEQRKVDNGYREQLRERLALSSEDLGRRIREYSTGMKRKLGLIQAFQSDPPLLILDEPTEGLDPLMQESFYDLLSDVRGRGRTIFMSSHILSEVERVCDRIGLLRKGELVLLSKIEEVRKLAARRVRVIFSATVGRRPELPAEHEVLDCQPGMWTLRVNGPMGPLLAALAGLPVEDLLVEEPRLEDVVMKYYRDDEV
jgi:ABC-2 type transport system ATP-binding protein